MSWKKYIESDKKRWGEFKKPLLLPQYKIIFLKRKCEYWRERNIIIFFIYRVLFEHFSIKYGINIPAKVSIGKGIRIEHIGGIVINPHVKLGDNITLLNGVLIGSQLRGNKMGYPEVGNNVWIGTNAIIVGEVRIGNNVLIAPGAYVNFDVPDNSIVIGNPGVIKYSEHATAGYTMFPFKE